MAPPGVMRRTAQRDRLSQHCFSCMSMREVSTFFPVSLTYNYPVIVLHTFRRSVS